MVQKEPTAEHEALATYIIEWLRRRNRSELKPALDAMRVVDARLMHEELARILLHGGHPPNWVPREPDPAPVLCGADNSIPFEHATLGQRCSNARPCPDHDERGNRRRLWNG